MNIQQYKDIALRHSREFKLFRDAFFPIVMKWEGGGKLHNVKGDSGSLADFKLIYKDYEEVNNDFNIID